MNYRELDRRSNQIAHALIRHGVKTGERVAVSMERSAHLVISLLGILKAGAAYVPIDRRSSVARRDLLLQRAQARLLLVRKADGEAAEPFSLGETVELAVDEEQLYVGVPEETPSVEVSPDDLMYLMFTSGTTGEPKGVMIPHQGVVNILSWMVDEYGFSARDRVLQKTPYTFDASVWELFLPLISGGSVVMARPGGQSDPSYLIEATRSYGITTLQVVPSMLRHLIDQPHLSECVSLRHVFCGGEQLTPELRDRLLEALPIPLHNLYGPTEASIQVMTWTCQPGDRRPYVPIGRPIANVAAFVFDEDKQPVPAGQVGELYLGGVALAKGYLDLPDLTARSFVANPDQFSLYPTLYRTGDLVREHPDGTYEYVSRCDDQVKIHGFRVELGSIETHLRNIAKVNNAAVTVESAERTGEPHLVAYLETAGEVEIRDLRTQLSDRIPEHMIPTKFKVLNRFPLSEHGKLDKNALRNLPSVTLTVSSGADAPSTEMEKNLATIWSEVLDVKPIGVRDDFFEIGGDSIAGLIVISQARPAGIVITPEDIFRLRNIAAVSAAVTKRSG